MEYSQELDTLKTEINSSVKKIEDLTKAIETLNNFQENDSLSRIETKLDILAQTDYSEILGFSIENLKENLAENIELIRNQLDYINVKFNENSASETKEISESLNNIKTDLIESIESLKTQISCIETKLNNTSSSPENEIPSDPYPSLMDDLTFVKENFHKISEKFSEITLLIRTNTAESEELNNRFETNLVHFNTEFQNIYERFNVLDTTFKDSFVDFKACIQDVYDQFSTIDNRNDLDQIKFYIQTFNNKITSIHEILDKLKQNDFLIKVDNHGDLIKESNEILNKKLEIVLNETQNFSNRISDEFSTLVNPLSSAIELTCGLKESIEDLLSNDDIKVKKETYELLEKFEEVHKNAENNLENVFNASKHFYEKLEEIKNEFGSISYDTNSKINDFISKVDSIEFKIQNNLASSESALSSLRNISRYTENQINLTSETLNVIKTNVSELSDDINFLKNDITDISSKINKVILDEKENTASTISSFSSLKEEINKHTESNIENINNTGEKIIKKLSEELKDLSKKVDKTEEISADNLETSEDIKNALTYIAEWFDSAGKLIEENNRNLKKNPLEKIDFLIKRTEENITEQIKRLSDKLNRLEVRMESIEGKVEKLHEQRNNREILNLLSDVLEKVELSNERSKSGEVILDRLESLELKLQELEDKKNSGKNKKKITEEEKV